MRRVLITLALLLIVACATSAGPIHSTPFIDMPPDTKSRIDAFDAAVILNFASKEYYKEIDEARCATELLGGKIAACLGEYSEYYTPEEFRKLFNAFNSIPYGGIGTFLFIKNGALVVRHAVKDYPAFKAGVRKGDILLAAKNNGKETSLTGYNLLEINNILGGKIFTPLALVIRRGAEIREVTVIRELIYPWHVIPQDSLWPGNVGYLPIIDWNDGASVQFSELADSLIKLGAKKFIFDVRNNPGGRLKDALEAITHWEEDDNAPLLTMRGKYPKQEIYTRASLRIKKWRVFPATLKDIPCVVLINKNSASSAEIFAGFLKATGCHIIGDKSFGKGTVQDVVPLKSGAAFKLTTAEYFIRLNIKIDGVGVAPTLLVSNPPGWYPGDEDNDLQLKAALRRLKGQPLSFHHGSRAVISFC